MMDTAHRDGGQWTRRIAGLQFKSIVMAGMGLAASLCAPALAAPAAPAEDFRKNIQPVLAKYCYDCHGGGESKGGVTFDQFKNDAELLQNHDLWWKVLKNTRSGLMPPVKKAQPTADEKVTLANWIKRGAFAIDPANPDPGRVTVRRLNRVEYHNTIRDLMGVDYNTTDEFPPDDTGYGFDTIGDVLSVSPMLLEKYMKAAESIVSTAVPTIAKTVSVKVLAGRDFHGDGVTSDRMSFTKDAVVSATTSIANAGDYNLVLEVNVRGSFDFDPGTCSCLLKIDDAEKWKGDFKWESGKKFQIEIPQKWDAGKHSFTFELHPGKPADVPVGGGRFGAARTSVDMAINAVRIEGPLDPKFWVHTKGYERFFSRDEAPTGDAERKQYAHEVLGAFATKAFRRPADPQTVDRLVAIAESIYSQQGKNFEQGIAHAMVAALSSPRFLFRVEQSAMAKPDEAFSLVDEYSLASRLSYFLWATMPDDELYGLAAKGELRKNLSAQVKRLMDDSRSEAMIRNFAGQWLEVRDVDSITIDARTVLALDTGTQKELDAQNAQARAQFGQFNNGAFANGAAGANGAGFGRGPAATQPAGAAAVAGAPAAGQPVPFAQAGQVPATQAAATQPTTQPGFAGRGPFARGNNPQQRQQQQLRGRGKPAVELDGPLREALRLEPEMYFTDIVRNNGTLADLLDSNYTFVNGVLAKHYGVNGVTGTDMRKVKLDADSPRGGLITMGSFLVVTSNPTRTSPVKRGQFILDNILGMPAPPPPPDIPALEESEKNFDGREPTFREVLELHRNKPLCRACHARMDPLGLSLENFNALGMYREKERGQPIDATGQLITGETFKNVKELKQILKQNHVTDFYRCLTEKLMIYALGRGLDYYDVESVDKIVDRLQKEDGHFSALLDGIINSAPFQERRNRAVPNAAPAPRPEAQVNAQ